MAHAAPAAAPASTPGFSVSAAPRLSGDASPINRLLEAMVRMKASDLHLSADNPPKIRVDGAIQNLPGGTHQTAEALYWDTQ